MKNEPRDFDELMREEEAKAYERTKKEIDAEMAAWNALPKVERERIMAEKEVAAEAERADKVRRGVWVEEAEESDDDEDTDEEE